MNYRVQAVERALDILCCFSFQNKEMTLTEIIQKTGLKKSTAIRLISNLVSRDFLRRDPDTKRYQLGLALFELGGIVFSSFSLRKAAGHPMSRLRDKTGSSVLLGVMLDDQLVYLDKREGRGLVANAPTLGWRRPLHHGMLGMVLMASLSSEEVQRILKEYPLHAYTPHSITDEDAFSLRLEEIRNQGYVIEEGETYEGLIGIAAPIRDYSRKVIASLGIAIYSGQSNLVKDLDSLAEKVKKTCDEISTDLGYLKV